MNNIIIIIYRYRTQFWVNPIQTIKWIKNLWFYFKNYVKIKKLTKNNKDFKINLNYPCLHDRNDTWWTAKWHYFHQDLLVARKIYKNNPLKHVDIWSRVDWFVAHIATFRDIEVFDIRNIVDDLFEAQFVIKEKTANLGTLWQAEINLIKENENKFKVEFFNLEPK